MFGLVLVGHGALARSMLDALEQVSGHQSQLGAICIGADDDMELRRTEILQMIADCDTGDGVIVLTDMFGGTPSNLAISTMDEGRIEVVAGMNLPMMVKFAELRDRPIAEAIPLAQEAGRKHMTIASRILAR
ncbi:PTS fructose transporter subunit IIA [Reyranella sp.]|uniref:PTS sugar transporter subunit IIA n=1 Tax=Reyranella sp. TaxID=1929291 RepID=UPI0012021699|nr:PTS fructose transporter subunit IIA [Reyranella sp.]TAJ83544.1 MAG: PTS fructose transporter subunit IIA [Reyranella sp.]